MDILLKFIITICIFSIMVIGGIYSYRFLNNKLTSSNTLAGIVFYAIALFITLALIYAGGLFLMAKMYHYLSG